MDGSSSAVNRTLPSSLVRRDSKKVAGWKLPDAALLFGNWMSTVLSPALRLAGAELSCRFNQFTGEPSGSVVMAKK